MPSSLYDLLEVSRTASDETIRENYKRLHARYVEEAELSGEDCNNKLIALREAFATLTDPGRRRRYDEKLAINESSVIVEPPASRPFFKIFLALLVAGAAIASYNYYQAKKEQARLEQLRQTELARVADERRLADEERRAQLAANKQEAQQRRQEMEERLNRERDYAYARQVSRENQIAEARHTANLQIEEHRRAREEAQRLYEAERQLARDKAAVRRMEAENQRWGR